MQPSCPRIEFIPNRVSVCPAIDAYVRGCKIRSKRRATALHQQRYVGFQVNLFVFDTTPQAFNKYAVDPATLATHTESDIVVLELLKDWSPPLIIISKLTIDI